jgi:uncharacterized protein Yka (UPF0111/DUF47 family)
VWLADLFSSRRINRFFAFSERHAGLLVQATSLFKDYCANGSFELANQINALRLQGSSVLNDLNTALRDSYVTPLDRQDIYNLGETVDDMLKYVNNAALEITLFGVQITPQMREIADVLDAAARQIKQAIENLRLDPQRAWQCAQDVEQAEARVEDRYRSAVLELFDGSDYHTIFKQREVYRHLSNSADRALAIGRLIGKIVVKAT